MARDSMVFYRSFYESAKLLKKNDRALLYEAIVTYQFTGEIIQLPATVMVAWVLIKPQLDKNNERYENGKQGKSFGIRGGKPKNPNPIGVTEANPIGVTDDNPTDKIHVTPNVNVNVNDNVNDNVNVNDNENVNAKKNPTPKEKKQLFGTFGNVKLTDTEYHKLLSDYSESTISDYIERLSLYVEQKGDKYKSHYATILTWIRKDGETNKKEERCSNPFLQMLIDEGEI